MKKNAPFIPHDVPEPKKNIFVNNYIAITRGTDRLLLMAADQKIEHLLEDFYASQVPAEVLFPEHLFSIAHAQHIGAFAAHLGLIAQFGKESDGINYIVKLNGKTNLIKTAQHDPRSKGLWTVRDVVQFADQSKISIRGVGYTIYLGSEHETEMLREAAHIIYDAHQEGLVTIIWMYPRGKAVLNERSGEIIAGAAGVAPCIGADFVKINRPAGDMRNSSCEWLSIAAKAAGKTRVLCSGGERIEPEIFLKQIYEEIVNGGIAGCAIGRNIYQHTLSQARAFTRALEKIIYENWSYEDALKELKK